MALGALFVRRDSPRGLGYKPEASLRTGTSKGEAFRSSWWITRSFALASQSDFDKVPEADVIRGGPTRTHNTHSLLYGNLPFVNFSSSILLWQFPVTPK